MIEANASKDKSDTKIRLDTALCDVFEPQYKGIYRNLDWTYITERVISEVSAILGKPNLVPDAVWGLFYRPGENPPVKLHNHGGVSYGAIYYIEAEEGCGVLTFLEQPDQGDYSSYSEAKYVEVTTGDLYIFDAETIHGVLPGDSCDSARVAIAFNIVDNDNRPKGRKEPT